MREDWVQTNSTAMNKEIIIQDSNNIDRFPNQINEETFTNFNPLFIQFDIIISINLFLFNNN